MLATGVFVLVAGVGYFVLVAGVAGVFQAYFVMVPVAFVFPVLVFQVYE